jgi:hypothetical protein
MFLLQPVSVNWSSYAKVMSIFVKLCEGISPWSYVIGSNRSS